VLSSGRPQFIAYSDHRVRRQFGFDQEVPAVMGIAAGEIPTINPFLKARAFAYWSGIAPQVVVPSGNRIGVYTMRYGQLLEGVDGCRWSNSETMGEETFPICCRHAFPRYPIPRLFVSYEHYDYLCKPSKFGLCCMALRGVAMGDIW
jgi:hypothetical protein